MLSFRDKARYSKDFSRLSDYIYNIRWNKTHPIKKNINNKHLPQVTPGKGGLYEKRNS